MDKIHIKLNPETLEMIQSMFLAHVQHGAQVWIISSVMQKWKYMMRAEVEDASQVEKLQLKVEQLRNKNAQLEQQKGKKEKQAEEASARFQEQERKKQLLLA